MIIDQLMFHRFRDTSSSCDASSKRYVITNPPDDFQLLPTDQVNILISLILFIQLLGVFIINLWAVQSGGKFWFSFLMQNNWKILDIFARIQWEAPITPPRLQGENCIFSIFSGETNILPMVHVHPFTSQLATDIVEKATQNCFGWSLYSTFSINISRMHSRNILRNFS